MLVRLLLLALVLVLGFLLATRAVPWLVVHAGRLVGFRMRPTPLTAKRLQRFRRIRRGHAAFLVVTTAFVLSLFLELCVNSRPLTIRYGDRRMYPAVAEWLSWLPLVDLRAEARAVAKDFGLSGEAEVPYRRYAQWIEDPARLEEEARRIEDDVADQEQRLRDQLAAKARERGEVQGPAAPLPEDAADRYAALREDAALYRRLRGAIEAGEASIVMPLYPYRPDEQLLDVAGSPPHRAFAGGSGVPPLGTDFEGKDVLSQLLYGFRVSFAFAVVVAAIGFVLGIAVGGIMGYFGGWVDILLQRFIEVWESIPFLFLLMILGSIVAPSFWLLVVLLVFLQAWTGITYTMRGEYYREKTIDYVQAARALGVRAPTIMARHILPNALVPVVTFLPFAIVAYIDVLVSLDYLGFGLPPSVPSWGRLLKQGAENVANYPELVLFPILALAATLFCVVLVGEAVREAFDPKLYSRLR